MLFRDFHNNMIIFNNNHTVTLPGSYYNNNNNFYDQFSNVITPQKQQESNYLMKSTTNTSPLQFASTSKIAFDQFDATPSTSTYRQGSKHNGNHLKLIGADDYQKSALHLDDGYLIEDEISPYALTFQSMKFRIDQAEFLCRTLESSNKISKLAYFIACLPPLNDSDKSDENEAFDNELFNGSYERVAWYHSEQIARAKALVLFHEGKFNAFYSFVASRPFASEHHSMLQELWNGAHYAETEALRGKKLDPVSRYRVRKKNPYPKTIWDGEGTSYCFKKSARIILREAYRRDKTPSQQQKRELAALTKLTVVQVSNWFKNQRQRARQYAREGRAPPATYDHYSSDENEDSIDSEPEKENDIGTDSKIRSTIEVEDGDPGESKRVKLIDDTYSVINYINYREPIDDHEKKLFNQNSNSSALLQLQVPISVSSIYDPLSHSDTKMDYKMYLPFITSLPDSLD